MQMPDSAKWRQAVEEELDSMRKNEVFQEVDRREAVEAGSKILRLFWLFKRKYNAEGKIIKYKARLVVLGNEQESGIDYFENYAPVVNIESLRVLLAFIVKYDMKFKVADVVTAFLNGSLEGEPPTYTNHPPGCAASSNTCLQLLKALYGLKVSPRKWCEKLTGILIKMGFQRCLYDRCVYVLNIQLGRMVVCVWVDDLPCGCSNERVWKWFIDTISQEIDIQDGGDCTSLCGLCIVKKEDGSYLLSQPAYISQILAKFGLSEKHSNFSKTLPDIANLLNQPAKPLEKDKLVNYRAAVGALRWLERATMPVITFLVNQLAKYNQNPTESHYKALKQTLRFVGGLQDYALIFRKRAGDVKLANIVVGFSDANLGDHLETKANSGHITFVWGMPVAWSGRKQSLTADSTATAEYVAMAVGAKTLLWIRFLVHEILSYLDTENLTHNSHTIFIAKQENVFPAIMFGDNNASLQNVNDIHVFSKAQRHLARKYHLVRELVLSGDVVVKRVSSEDNIADIFTKRVTRQTFEKFRDVLLEKKMR